jgi:hypothetical protein
MYSESFQNILLFVLGEKNVRAFTKYLSISTSLCSNLTRYLSLKTFIEICPIYKVYILADFFLCPFKDKEETQPMTEDKIMEKVSFISFC